MRWMSSRSQLPPVMITAAPAWKSALSTQPDPAGDFRHVSPRADLNDQLFLLLPGPPGARPGDALTFDRRRLARGIGTHRAYPGHR